MPQRDEYLLGYRSAEQDRLRKQAQQLADESSRLFDRLALAEGACVVEIGCGPQGCLDLLARRVGPSGLVIGIERSKDAVDLAKDFVREQGLTNVDIICGDASSTDASRAARDRTATTTYCDKPLKGAPLRPDTLHPMRAMPR